MRDDWRLRIDFGDPESFLDRLRHAEARELAEELRGHRLAVTRDDDTVFVYAPNRLQAEQTQALVERELGLDAQQEEFRQAQQQWHADRRGYEQQIRDLTSQLRTLPAAA